MCWARGHLCRRGPGSNPRQPWRSGISPSLSIGKHIFLTSPSAQLVLGGLQSLALVVQLPSQPALVLFLVTADLFCMLTSRYRGRGVVLCFFLSDRIYLELETNTDQALAGFAVASLLKIGALQFLPWPF